MKNNPIIMSKKDNFKIAARAAKLRLFEINTDGNDYPKGLGSFGVIGFGTIKEANEFANNNGGEVHEFQTKAGHTFWRDLGSAYNMYSYDDLIEKIGDNARLVESPESEKMHYFELIKGYAESKDMESIVKCIQQYEKYEAIECALSHGNVIICNDGIYEEVPRRMMIYSHDTHTYAIGVYFNPDLHSEDDDVTE